MRFKLTFLFFFFSYFTLVAQITNDDCDQATEIILGDQLEVDYGERRSDRLIINGCGYNSSHPNVWYQFTGTGAYVEVDLCGNASTTLDILDGDCNQLTCSDQITYGSTSPNNCGDQFSRAAVFYATEGKTYYILCSTNLYVTPDHGQLSIETTELIENNTCETAKPITIGGDKIELTYNHLRATSSGFLDCQSTNTSSKLDSWYAFEGTGAFVTLENEEYALELELYKGNCSQFKCIPNGWVTDKRAYPTELGKTYYLRVLSNYTSDREIILQSVELVENDECEGAIPIAFGDTITANFEYTVRSPIVCSQYSTDRYDVWYQFEGNDSTITIHSLSSRIGFSILSGNCEEWECESLTRLSSSYSIYTEKEKTYYLNVFRHSSPAFIPNKGSFYTIVSEPVVNDTYITALPIGCADTIYGSLVGAQKDIEINQRDMPSVWYKIIGTGEFYQYRAEYTDNWHSYTVNTALYKKEGNDFVSAGRFSNGYIYLEQDSIYYINVAGDRENDFKLMLNCKPNVEHDLCTEAKLIIPKDTIKGNIRYARIDEQATCSTYSYGDFWYRLEGNNALYNIKLRPYDTDYRFNFYKGNCEELNCITTDTRPVSYLGKTFLQEGETYYLQVYSRLSTWDEDVTFDLIFDSLQVAENDICINARKLECGSHVSDSLDHALLNEPRCNGEDYDPGIWYEFEGNDSYYVLDVTGINSSGGHYSPSYGNFALYEGNCEELLCLDNYFYQNREQLAFFAESGKTYFLVYRDNKSYSVEISVDCQTYLDNDDFLNAATIECDRQYRGFAHNNTYEFLTRCSNNYAKDAWFKTIGKGEYVYYTNSRIEGIYTLENNGMLCYGDGNEDRVFLEEGTTYYFRYIFATTAYTQLYDFSISCSPLLVNDNCKDALELNCGDSLTVNTVFSQGDRFDPECTTYGLDRRVIWYEIKGDGLWRDLTVSGGSFQLFRGDCSGLTCLDNARMFYTEPAVSYYLRIYGSSYRANYGLVTIMMECGEAPQNDLCENAQIISCGDTIQTSFDFVDFCDKSDNCEEEEEEKKIWYQLNGEGNWIHLTVSSRFGFTNSALSLEIYRNNCCEQEAVENLYGTEKDLFFYAEQDSIYLIAAMMNRQQYYSSFTLTANCVDIEDLDFNTCENARELNPNQAYDTNLDDAITYYNYNYLENNYPVRWVQFEGSGGLDTFEVDFTRSNLHRVGIYLYIDPNQNLDLLEVKKTYKNINIYNRRYRYEISTLKGVKYFVGVHIVGSPNTNRVASITWNPASTEKPCQLLYPDTIAVDYTYTKNIPFDLMGGEGAFSVYVSNNDDKSSIQTFTNLESGGSFNITPKTSSLYFIEYDGEACYGHTLMKIRVNGAPQDEPCIEVPFVCEEIIQHTDEELLDSTYQALKIESNAVIAYEAVVVYNAEEEVLLLPGFETEDESDFTADIVLCEETSSQQTDVIEGRSVLDTATKKETALTIAPNPFTEQTNLSYQLNEASEVHLLLFSVQGKLVRSVLSNQKLEAGKYNTTMNSSNLKAGMYYLLLHTNQEKLVRKLIIVK